MDGRRDTSSHITLITPDEALQQARDAKPQVYYVSKTDNTPLMLCAFGCHGEEGPTPKKVMQLLNAVLTAHPEKKPDIILHLGDNIYPSGVDHVCSEKFKTQFDDNYADRLLSKVYPIPCAEVSGNHDEGRDTKSKIKMSVNHWTGGCASNLMHYNQFNGREAILRQIGHCYLNASEVSQKRFFDATDLPKYFMPSDVYIIDFNAWQLFILNSNSYAKDFLIAQTQLAKNEVVDSNNQTIWIKKAYEQAKQANKSVIIGMHHPLLAFDKRAFSNKFDAKHYLEPKEITQLQHILALDPKAPSYLESVHNIITQEYTELVNNADHSEMLKTIFYHFQNIHPDIWLTAHAHAFSFFNNKEDHQASDVICQVGSGIGGNHELHPRFLYDRSDYLGAYVIDHGFTLIQSQQNNPAFFQVELYTLGWADYLKKQGQDDTMPYLIFNSNQCHPIKSSNHSTDIEPFFHAIKAACHIYQQEISEKQKSPTNQGKNIFTLASLFEFSLFNQSIKSNHPPADAKWMDALICFINTPATLDKAEIIRYLYDTMEKMIEKTTVNCLYQRLIQQFEKFLPGKTIKEMHDEVASQNFKK